MSMASGELETMLAVKFLEKRLISSYSMIIAKVFESAFESCYASTKLKVLYNWYNRQVVGFIVSGDTEDNLMFIMNI